LIFLQLFTFSSFLIFFLFLTPIYFHLAWLGFLTFYETTMLVFFSGESVRAKTRIEEASPLLSL